MRLGPVKTWLYQQAAEDPSLRWLRMTQGSWLRELMARAHKSPFYREQFRKSGISPRAIRRVSDLPKLGFFTDSKQLQLDPKSFLTVPESHIHRISESSGSLGPSKFVYFSKEDWLQLQDSSAKAMTWLGITSRDVVQVLYHNGDSEWMVGDLVAEAVLRIGAKLLNSGDAPSPDEQLSTINEHGTTVLYGTPSYLHRITKELSHQHKLRDTTIHTIRVGGEPFSVEMREWLETQWGAKVYDNYGMSELGSRGASECSRQEHLHITPTVLVEVIDPATGQLLPRGHKGELVFTTLKQKAAPLIRYRSGDLGRLLARPVCPCGRIVSDMMERVSRRLDEQFIIGGAVKAYPAQFRNALSNVDELDAFQVVLDKRDYQDVIRARLETKTVPSPDWQTAIKKRILSAVVGLELEVNSAKLVAPVELEFLKPGTLHAESPIKRRVLVDKRPRVAAVS